MRKANGTIAEIALVLVVAAHLLSPGAAKAQAVAPDRPAIAAPVEPGGWTIGDVAQATGRVLVSPLFVIAGVRKIANFGGTAALMTANGIPYAETLLVPTIALEIGGGLALALNYHPDWAAGALGLFLVPATLIFHDFWTIADPVLAMREQIQFLKNTAILGGLLAIAGQGASQ